MSLPKKGSQLPGSNGPPGRPSSPNLLGSSFFFVAFCLKFGITRRNWNVQKGTKITKKDWTGFIGMENKVFWR
jgi:hypothetical protein